jgi:histidyl-tRNA synthetase
VSSTMSKYQTVRGTRDLVGKHKKIFRHIEATAYSIAQNYGFQEIETPMFEFSEVFHRAMGETSDAVSKETYSFTDRGGDQITLRPEGTAGVVRAYITEGMAQHNPNRLYYYGPMFRYERPQKGRYRQFFQIGVEVLGLDTPLADVECIDLGFQILKKLGLHGRCHLEINTLGDTESRQRYREALVQYLTPLREQLSADSQLRLQKNPLRILDSKDATDQSLVANAPRLENFLSPEANAYFKAVCRGLDLLGLPYKVNSQLVRGLDYYCHTVFEFVTTELGAQGALLAGGRYDGLSETLGGPKTPGVGWASGVDRLAELLLDHELEASSVSPLITVITLGDQALLEGLKQASQIRARGQRCEFLMTGNFKKKLEKANKLNTSKALLIFQQEDGSMEFKIKNFESGEESICKPAEVLQKLI